jgi:aryl-alcohol dehydrogenase-like predicted oxidoreductase
MLYSRLGTSGLIVSRLSLGVMTFTSGAGPRTIAVTDEPSARAILDQAIDQGVNFFDTADVYNEGQSEEILGRLLGNRRHAMVIATKAGWRSGKGLNDCGLGAKHLHASIDRSLQRLGTDYVDTYIAHRNDLNTPLEETLYALDQIVRSGKARSIGFSNWPAWKVTAALALQKANGWAPFSHGQMMYSLLGRGIEDEIVPMARHFGVGLTAWSPLAGGFLSGKYTRDNLTDPDKRLSGTGPLRFDADAGFALVDRLRDLAEAHGASVAQVALAWVLAKPEISSVIVGASKLHQLDDNLAAARLTLAPEELAELDTLTAPAPVYPNFVANVVDAPIDQALAATPAHGFTPDALPA